MLEKQIQKLNHIIQREVGDHIPLQKVQSAQRSIILNTKYWSWTFNIILFHNFKVFYYNNFRLELLILANNAKSCVSTNYYVNSKYSNTCIWFENQVIEDGSGWVGRSEQVSLLKVLLQLHSFFHINQLTCTFILLRKIHESRGN